MHHALNQDRIVPSRIAVSFGDAGYTEATGTLGGHFDIA